MRFKLFKTVSDVFVSSLVVLVQLGENLLFYSPIFSAGKKKKTKVSALNSKTIRFDQKKWKDNLVLHYLISE